MIVGLSKLGVLFKSRSFQLNNKLCINLIGILNQHIMIKLTIGREHCTITIIECFHLTINFCANQKYLGLLIFTLHLRLRCEEE